jgi:arylsulfatase A-like enzyme
VQFKSLMPLITGKAESSYDAIYGGYIDLQRMVSMDGYKMIYYPKIDKTLLYNLKGDPFEMENLADDPANAGLIKKLKARLKDLQIEVGDTFDINKSAKS